MVPSEKINIIPYAIKQAVRVKVAGKKVKFHARTGVVFHIIDELKVVAEDNNVTRFSVVLELGRYLL